ncbi:aminotransferase class I/II-fold pyridoxal phosphate-dependent enzyme, partial [[Clostridium] symbiosum]|uniref:aminotransferase class I/II-fold pyridoxal phosphate-dependent enzyme n=1 Tax=Clostridium symbiosum TaxID=1512 RepID=UPI002108651B
DEVYEHIIFKPNVHVHMAGLPGMYERTITCNSLSKTYGLPAFLGYLTAASNSILSRAGSGFS